MYRELELADLGLQAKARGTLKPAKQSYLARLYPIGIFSVVFCFNSKIIMKKLGLFLCFFLSLFRLFAQQEETFTHELYYANQSADIYDLYILGEEQSIALTDFGIVLLNKNRAFSDTFKTSWRPYKAEIIDKNNFLAITANEIYHLKTENGKLVLQNKNNEEQIHSAICNKFIGKLIPNAYTKVIFLALYKGFFVAYHAEKDALKKLKEPPIFFVSNGNQILNINEKEKAVQGDFADYALFQYSKYWGAAGDKLFFNLPQTNKVYFFDTKSSTVSFFKFPENEKREIFRLHYDHIAEKFYAVAQKNKKIKLFRLDFEKMTLVKVSEISLDGDLMRISDNHLHVRRSVKEGKKRFYAHYLHDIYGENQKNSFLDTEK